MSTAELETQADVDAAMEEIVTEVNIDRAADPDLIAQLINANRQFKAQESRHAELKEETKAAKEEMDGSARLISRLISQMEFDDDRPLFANLDKAETESPSWRAVSIDDLDDISDSARALLKENGASCLGGLADMIASETWPKGFGPKKQEQVKDAINLWHDNNGAVDSADVPVEEV